MFILYFHGSSKNSAHIRYIMERHEHINHDLASIPIYKQEKTNCTLMSFCDVVQWEYRIVKLVLLSPFKESTWSAGDKRADGHFWHGAIGQELAD